jgi:hypothetical protein
MRNALKPVSPEAIAAEISRLEGLPLKELKAAWTAEFRREPPKGLWRDLLLRTLAWRIQEKAFGGHDKATLKLLDGYGRKKGGDQHRRRLKTGTVLMREFEGSRHTVTIVPDGFLWQEKTFCGHSTLRPAPVIADRRDLRGPVLQSSRGIQRHWSAAPQREPINWSQS